MPHRNTTTQPLVSSRAMNPLGHDEDVKAIFCDHEQARATTATRLFRDEEMLHALETLLLKPHIRQGKTGDLHIWSAGCSSGEEPYSLAMVGAALFAKAGMPPRLRVFGTDISHEQIRRAHNAVYSIPQRHNRYTPLVERYTVREGGRLRIADPIRRLVKCGIFDLRTPPRRHTFHFIVCNHVLQYYDQPAQLRILRNFFRVLRPGGYLFLEGLTASTIQPSGLIPVPGFRQIFQPPRV